MTVALATGSLSFCDNTVPDTVFSCAAENRASTNNGTIRVNRLIISISRSLENEDKEKSESGTYNFRHLAAEKNAILAIIRKPEGWPSDFRYRDP